MCHEGSYNTLPLVSTVYERHVHPINFQPNYKTINNTYACCPFSIITIADRSTRWESNSSFEKDVSEAEKWRSNENYCAKRRPNTHFPFPVINE